MSDKVVPGINIDDIIELIDQELGEPVLPRPDGFGVTVREYADRAGCNEDIARDRLNEMVERGKLEKKRLTCGTGSAPYVYYVEDREEK